MHRIASAASSASLSSASSSSGSDCAASGSSPPASYRSPSHTSASYPPGSPSSARTASSAPYVSSDPLIPSVEDLHLSFNGHRHPLTDKDIRALLDQVRENCLRGYSLWHFLDSIDPGAHMLTARRELLMKRCLHAADAHYMEDQWPDVGTGTGAYPDDRLLPALNKHHWELTQTRTVLIDGLAEEISDNAWRNLRTFAAPLRIELEHLKQLLSTWTMTFNAPCLQQAEQQLKWVEVRPDVSEGADCRINKDVAKINELHRTVSRTVKAVKVLNAALTGYKSVHGDTPFFNSENYPAYYQQWLAAVRHVEKEEWSAFTKQQNALREERKQLLAKLPPSTISDTTSDC